MVPSVHSESKGNCAARPNLPRSPLKSGKPLSPLRPTLRTTPQACPQIITAPHARPPPAPPPAPENPRKSHQRIDQRKRERRCVGHRRHAPRRDVKPDRRINCIRKDLRRILETQPPIPVGVRRMLKPHRYPARKMLVPHWQRNANIGPVSIGANKPPASRADLVVPRRRTPVKGINHPVAPRPHPSRREGRNDADPGYRPS
jgi:hypothetical protein